MGPSHTVWLRLLLGTVAVTVVDILDWVLLVYRPVEGTIISYVFLASVRVTHV